MPRQNWMWFFTVAGIDDPGRYEGRAPFARAGITDPGYNKQADRIFTDNGIRRTPDCARTGRARIRLKHGVICSTYIVRRR
jgi:hypothetical protein